FSDGGRYSDPDSAVSHALAMVAEGARIIDVGGESTRPGAREIDAQEEIRRIVPVISKLRAQTNALICVDTSKPEVIRAAAQAGAAFINDVRALTRAGALAAAAETDCGVCLMHMRGEPSTMQIGPRYDNVVVEVTRFLGERVRACHEAGIALSRIAVD